MSVGRRVLAGAAALAAVAAVGVPTSPAAAATLIPATFTFSGAGSSHGVGMSQWGARGMALEGYTAEQIVTHYYSGTTVTPVADSRNIRVNVLHRQTKAVFRTEALAAGGGGIRVEVVGSPAVVGDASDVWTLTSGNGPVTVTRTRGGVTTKVGTGALAVVRWAGTRDSGGTGTAATLLNLASSFAGFATSGHRFRYGTLDFATTPASPTTFEAVNPVRIHDEYLLGISEISSSWPMEALRAQVLASRSYALARVGETQRAACRCNVDNGFGGYYDQTFVAWSKESGALGNRWRQAVLSTGSTASTGETILYAGKPIQAFYFAASGGATQSSADVWGGALPWAVSVDDHWSMDPSVPWSSWNPRVRTQAQVAAVFGLPNVVRLDLTDRSVAGALRNVTAWSSTGASKTVSGVHFAGSSGLGFPSRWVWRAGDATPNAIVAAAAVTAATSATTTAVIAPTTSPASIAVASVLAARKGWPLLLSSGAGLPAATIADLKRRKATRAVVVGTVANEPTSVLTALSALGATPTRITGATDSDVSASAASSLGYPAGGVAWVAAATDLPSLASAASAAARAGRPFLVEPGGATASTSVSAYLTGLAPARTLVVGAVSAVAAAVASALPGDARLVGADASQTSALVLNATGLPVASRVVVASPNTAIAGLLISAGSPVIIVTGALPTPTLQYLQRGVVTVASPAGTPVAYTWAARRA